MIVPGAPRAFHVQNQSPPRLTIKPSRLTSFLTNKYLPTPPVTTMSEITNVNQFDPETAQNNEEIEMQFGALILGQNATRKRQELTL